VLLFNAAASTTEVEWNCKLIMNGEMVEIWKATFVLYFAALRWHLPAGPDEKYEETYDTR
jgi:hypothetical protein